MSRLKEESQNILFCPLYFEIPFSSLLREIKALDWATHSYWDSYRKTQIMPAFTFNGVQKQELAKRNWGRTDGQRWADNVSQAAPTLVKFIENSVFTWMNPKGNVSLLKTSPMSRMDIHVDASRAQVALSPTLHKFRILLTGQTDSLYFETTEGKIHAPGNSRAYILDGSWPHGMDNKTTLDRYVIAIGWPWFGELNSQRYIDLLSESKKLDPVSILYKDDYQLPENWSCYFAPTQNLR